LDQQTNNRRAFLLPHFCSAKWGRLGGGVLNHKRDIKIFKNAFGLRQNLTDAENKLWGVLRMHQMDGVHFRRQHAIGHYIVDFCSPANKIVIEVDGGQHLAQETYDLKRTTFLESKGYRVLRFWDHEVLNDLDAVLRVIFDSINPTE
jgi:very-short-patch-repair endonuclease